MVKRQNNARNRSKRTRRGEPGTLVSLSMLVLLAVGAFEVFDLLGLWPAQTRDVMSQRTDLKDRGTVVLKTEGDRCERMKYDEAGRVVERFRPCANADLNLDEHGKPLPVGTMRRLDAIGNSFLGRQ
jgi:YD repeat-containing protein